MDLNNLLNTALTRFERLVRWIYPGLLFWAVLPLAIQSGTIAGYVDFYKQFPITAQAMLVVVSGFVLYLVERLLLQEGFLGMILYRRSIGAAANFRRGQAAASYSLANGRFLWTRFGRPNSYSWSVDKDAEERFSSYMMGRMSWVHALGTTWLVGAVAGAVGLLGPSESYLKQMHRGWVVVLGVVLVVLIIGWVWHVTIAARAEQAHYQDTQS